MDDHNRRHDDRTREEENIIAALLDELINSLNRRYWNFNKEDSPCRE